MSKRCELTGISPLKGHNVSHAKNKTKRRFLPNLKKVIFRSDILKKDINGYYVEGPDIDSNDSNVTTIILVTPNTVTDLRNIYVKYNLNPPIEDIKYTDTGSTIYDFFRNNEIPFTSDNIKLLYPLIRIYATQKKLNPLYSATTFASDITAILNKAEKQRNSIEQQFRGKLPSALLGQKQEQTQDVNSKLDGDIIKLEQWELFKAVNDKWVAGRNFKERLLFEEFLFFDKANRDIGDELIVNTDTIRKYCTWDNSSNSIMSNPRLNISFAHSILCNCSNLITLNLLNFSE